MRISLFSAALVAALVGYGSTIALLLAAAQAVGATPEQTGSWIFAICLAKAAGSAFLSLRARMPIVLAWSTPGAALVAASQGLSMAEAVAAFLFAGLLIALTGALRPLGRMIAALPDAVAAAMLAGVLLPFCLKVPGHAAALPALILPVVAVFLAVRLFSPAQAVLAALATGLILSFALPGAAALPDLSFTLPRLTFIAPDFDIGALIGLGLPLYLVTMASQNLPGFAVLRAAGYTPPVRPALVVTGGLSALTALAGAHTISMAAITAAICLGEDVHPDRAQRWKVGLVYAAIWVVLGLFGPVILTLIGAMPAALVATIAGLALIAPFLGAASAAFAAVETRFAAGTTLIVTASGVAVFGIGAAFWGLIAGLLVHALDKARRRPV
ncbi:benzoate/H(+) symporter BenE family transporter [Frigidibacter albus]|uniref:Benzoate/H(+) symporter BenE family transporter n=1 Tax=Frigidibacter albus TaxID=1465486 RepID=A0A6L8VI36_9RHOB|nr:benzoate/H(+) symporter BenE family transporter [Frigidibacter albus]MZQ89784.1 benzoate/H(+) symporter BenE family transporter [Frigidibacter albus]NBE31841.1 benzoate/H(+) symporter BenE family transporter [Frigidibacter albus]GGH56683.1 benzoate transporter [Frigidibacter albus]